MSAPAFDLAAWAREQRAPLRDAQSGRGICWGPGHCGRGEGCDMCAALTQPSPYACPLTQPRDLARLQGFPEGRLTQAYPLTTALLDSGDNTGRRRLE